MTDSARLEAFCYATLGARPGASRKELRRAYIASVNGVNPDLFQSSSADRAKAESRMRHINESYEYLSRLGARPPLIETETEPDELAKDFARWSEDPEDRKIAPPVENEIRRERPRIPPEPRWPSAVSATFGCYGVIRIVILLSPWSLPVVLVAAWTYTLIQGLRKKLVVYANLKDVALSLITGIVLLAGHLTGNIYTTLTGLLLCAISAIWSIRRNRSILIGLAACLFKITFSLCWVALIMAPWFIARSDKQLGATKTRSAIFCGYMVFLISKLVNRRQH
jgi:hypothetical protein